MEAKEALERDWSSLLPEVLNLIAKTLIEIIDFVRFRAVCMAWRSSTTIADLPPQFPWIFEERHRYEDDLRFYSISFGKIYNIHTAKSLGKMSTRSSDKYIQLFHITGQRSLLNPLNDHEIPIHAYDCHNYPRVKGPWQNCGVHMVCYGPPGYQKYPESVYCQFDQEKWCELILGLDYANCDLGDCNLFYLNGMLFNVDSDTGVTKVTDVATNTLAYVIPPVEGYLGKNAKYDTSAECIMDASGDILRVFRYYDFAVDWSGYCFDIHRLDVNESGSVFWVKVDNIGNHALFLNMDGGFVLRAYDFVGVKRNCI
ncbi:F-box domain-containing protein [Rhynchospora pubera]|uniref:F-box domain-containing protein n=1 Tax=Rhynchospora pubera TaxID=906938 RepID=A0AAV8GIG6_9POAL|nr:F-box domain-containing protein [Rhynchospora pubera]